MGLRNPSHSIVKLLDPIHGISTAQSGLVLASYTHPAYAQPMLQTLALRADLQGTGVRVTNVEPGMCETDFSLVRFKGDTEKAGKVYANTTPLTADDVAEAVFWAATLPPHFNVNRVEIMPTTQAFGPLAIHRSQ